MKMFLAMFELNTVENKGDSLSNPIDLSTYTRCSSSHTFKYSSHVNRYSKTLYLSLAIAVKIDGAIARCLTLYSVDCSLSDHLR
jgi:hypothetical protein